MERLRPPLRGRKTAAKAGGSWGCTRKDGLSARYDMRLGEPIQRLIWQREAMCAGRWPIHRSS
jgi:hypothetical protein